MKKSLIALIGVGVAVLYGLLSRRLSGNWNVALSFELGVATAVALSGVRSRMSKEEEGEKVVKVEGEGGEKVEVEGRGQGGEKVGGESRWRAEEGSDFAGQPTDDGREDALGAPQSTGNADSLGNDCGAPGGRPLPQQNESDVQRHVHCPPPPLLSTSYPPPPLLFTSSQPQPFPSTSSQPPSTFSPAALWERARVMVHNVIPDSVEDAEYLDLVVSAAEQGYVPALAKLGDYAFRRGAFVEAYFWTKIAKRRLELSGDAEPQGMKEIDDMLQNIRREWSAAGRPPEFENVYDSFPEERGELGRAFLRLDGGVEVKQTREYIRFLADKGNPDAALFVS